MKSIITFILFFYSFGIYCQKHDNNWQVCYSIDDVPPTQYWFLNFDSAPPSLLEYFSPIVFNNANLVMSDPEGNLIFYSNGSYIADAGHSIMENGDTINPGIGWNETGYLQSYTIFSIPDLSHSGIYYIIHSNIDTTSYLGAYAFKNVLYSVIDINLNNGLGSVTSKNNVLQNGLDLAFPAAVKHANGRDWWIMIPDWFESKYSKHLLTPDGFTEPVIQEIGYKPPIVVITDQDVGSNKIFTPDGSKYIDYDSRNGIRLFDFDRCTGLLSNPRNCDVAFFGWGAAAVSPNSRFLYVTQSRYILQYDLEEADICASKDTIAYSEDLWVIRAPALAPDGKIYIQCHQLNNHKMHIIQHPDLKGDLCQFELNAMDIPCENIDDIPAFPNYRLYDIPGSPCDTLGIDDPNVATHDVPEKTITVFPNPASEMIYADVSGLQANELHYTLSDITGRVIRTAAVPVFQEKISIACAGLADGVYFLSLYTEGIVVVTEKVVVLKDR